MIPGSRSLPGIPIQEMEDEIQLDVPSLEKRLKVRNHGSARMERLDVMEFLGAACATAHGRLDPESLLVLGSQCFPQPLNPPLDYLRRCVGRPVQCM